MFVWAKSPVFSSVLFKYTSLSIPYKGWGLRTLTPITQGSFILSYIGELITDEEAERREDTYLFNLDLKVILFVIFNV